ncbi:E3 SUMO-protein ligase KIAA1586-like [Eurosta solidaginis]|uniref:E3 SUMO-protein ligase KIAA1586-like n=1 Tax=Eurosta solidaginis TaxID=178769 RepID=UPI00353174B6
MLYKQKIRQSWLSDKRFNQGLILRDNSLSCKYCLCKLQPKLSGLISHANRNKHIDALAPFKTGCQPMVPFKPARIIVDTKRADLRNAIHIAIHTSIRSVDHLTMMQKSTFLDRSIASNLQLGRTKCSALITNVLSPYFTKNLLEDIGSAQFSLIIDESTDSATNKQLGIVIRYYSASTKRFINTFLRLVELSNSTAEGIVDAILKTLQECNLDINKLIGLGTDNASTMVGINKGVIALLKNHNKNIILMPCICHSIQLAVSSASKYIPNDIEFLISESYNWFSKSASRQNSYKQIFSLINDGHEPYKLVRAYPLKQQLNVFSISGLN